MTYALGGRDDAMSVRTLLELSGDESGEVRDWATFGLGSLCTLDTPEVRAALVARLADAQPEVRGEAMVGLACRGDLRVLDVILGELGRPAPGWFVFEAAEQLLGAHPDNEELRRALATAGAGRRGGSPPRQGDP